MGDFEDKRKYDFASVFWWSILVMVWFQKSKNRLTAQDLLYQFVALRTLFALWERRGVDAFWRSGSLRVKKPAFKIFSGKLKKIVVLHLTYLGRSFKVDLLWGDSWPLGRVGQKEKSVLGYLEHGEAGTLVLFRFHPNSSSSSALPTRFFLTKFSLVVR